MSTVEGKVVIVTGATSGIGRGAASELAKAGFSVVLAGRSEDKGVALQDELREQGLQATFVRTDVTNDADLKRLFETTIETYGRLDFLFNNAGTAEWVTLDHEDAARLYDSVYSLNVRSVIRSFFYAVPLLAKSGGGLIVNNSSCASVITAPTLGIYGTSKTAVDAVTRIAAAEFKDRNIKVFSINPYLFESELSLRAAKALGPGESPLTVAAAHNPSGRPGKGGEIGEFLVELFVGRHDGRYESGANIAIDAGKDHFPVAEVLVKAAAMQAAKEEEHGK
ncbi:Gluconate 5-dehydrogenase [Balamuthia mandrillaris]